MPAANNPSALREREKDGLFWSVKHEERQAVAIALATLFDKAGVTPGEISNRTALMEDAVNSRHLKHLAKNGRDLISGKRTAAASASWCKLDDAAKFTPILEVLLRILSDRKAATAFPEHTKKLKKIRSELLAVRVTAPTKVDNVSVHSEAIDQRGVEQEAVMRPREMGTLEAAVYFLASLMGTDLDDLDAVKDGFFTRAEIEGGVNEKHYLCYRFHSDPKKVVKSFFAFRPPTAEAPICTFSHAFRKDQTSSVRVSSGIVFPSPGFVYCVGPMKDHQAIKIMMLRRRAPSGTYNGLTLSMDDDGTPVAARILLRETTASHSDAADIRILEFAEAKAELGKDLALIRNKIPFELEEDLLWKDDIKINQKRMVHEVFARLKDQDDQPLFRNVDGSEFNPADSSHYTFNAALPLD